MAADRKIEVESLGFNAICDLTKLVQAAEKHPAGRDFLIALTLALGDLRAMIETRDADHVRMVAALINNIAQPDGVHAVKASEVIDVSAAMRRQ